MTNITDESIQAKILKYHQLVREDKDTASIQAEIHAFTEQYLNNIHNELGKIKIEKALMDIEDKGKVTRKQYNRLIDLYRMAHDIMLDISKTKKAIRDMKQVKQ